MNQNFKTEAVRIKTVPQYTGIGKVTYYIKDDWIKVNAKKFLKKKKFKAQYGKWESMCLPISLSCLVHNNICEKKNQKLLLRSKVAFDPSYVMTWP